MKQIVRVLIILAAALAVAGATYASVQSGAAQAVLARAGEGRRGPSAGADFPAGLDQGGFRGGEHHGPSLLGAAQMARPLATMVVLVAAGAAATSALRRRPGRRARRR